MTEPTRAQLLHLAARARDGRALPAEHDALVAGISIMAAQLAELDGAANVAVSAVRLMNEAGARTDRYRAAWTSARRRVKRAQRNQEAELRWANNMWSDALRDLGRYRQAWKSARHRAALYLQSNQNLAASLDNGHAVQLHARRVAQSAARDAATALTYQLAAEHRAEQAEAAIERVLSPEGIRAAAEAMGDEALTHLGRDLGTIHVDHIAEAGLRAALDQAQQPRTAEKAVGQCSTDSL
ncbi:hypothetical protein [Streptomyces sp. NPDC088115]|uniref:hypothetical protein n=1 Tax=Streptomyces sp. NPDC088115 TaxID=3365824 RepID=UPI00382A3BF1